MKLSFSALCLVVSLFFVGCMKQQYNVGGGAKTSAANKVDQRWDLHFFWGLVGTSRVPVNCPSGNATVVTVQTPLNVIVKSLTGGIVSPSTTTVWCESSRAEVPLTPEEQALVLRSAAFLSYVEETQPEQADALRAYQATQ